LIKLYFFSFCVKFKGGGVFTCFGFVLFLIYAGLLVFKLLFGNLCLLKTVFISIAYIPMQELGNEQMSRNFGTGKAVKADYFETESAFFVSFYYLCYKLLYHELNVSYF
jgi:hypothetical protein